MTDFKSKKKVLILGLGQSNFLSPLYKSVNQQLPNFEFIVQKFKNIDNSDENIFKDSKDYYAKPSKTILNCSTGLKLTYLKFFITVLLDRGLKSSIYFLSSTSKEIFKFSKYKSFDFYHFHFANHQNLITLPLINTKNSKVIISFWGSDLLRNSNLTHFHISSYALSKAWKVTVQSIELKEILLAKFGRNLESKICVQKFKLQKDIFDMIDNYSITKKSKYIKTEKVNILVGHNASVENQHIKIVESLLNIKNQSDYNLIFAFGYGINDSEFKRYYENLITNTLYESNFSFCFINDYLNTEEISVLRKGAQICIHLPVSDALSAAITESMYAGNMVITGAWLPYGSFRRAGCKMWEILEFDEIIDIVRNYSQIVVENDESLRNNKVKVENEFLTERIDQKWVQLYRD
jgi:hypothetical protein